VAAWHPDDGRTHDLIDLAHANRTRHAPRGDAELAELLSGGDPVLVREQHRDVVTLQHAPWWVASAEDRKSCSIPWTISLPAATNRA